MRRLISLRDIKASSAGAVAIVLSAWFNVTHAAETRMELKILDSRNETPVNGNILCYVRDNQLVLEFKQAGRFESSVFIGEREELRFEIKAEPDYENRKVHLRSRVIPSTISLTLYAARKSESYTYQYLERGLQYHDRGAFDRALAHYEAAYYAPSSSPAGRFTQFHVKLKYNYVRALANACMREGYATCDEARRLIGELKDDATNHPQLFKIERINVPELDKTLRDMSASLIGSEYNVFRDLFAKNQYETAAKTAEQLLGQYDTEARAFADVRLSKDRLLEDTGTAYFRASERLDPASNLEERRQFLKRAIKYFYEIKDKREVILLNISTAEQRM